MPEAVIERKMKGHKKEDGKAEKRKTEKNNNDYKWVEKKMKKQQKGQKIME